jgi:microcystin-dependent protein
MSVKNSLGFQGYSIPVGTIIPWFIGRPDPAHNDTPIPATYRKCDGTSLFRADYPALFEVLGTLYGANDALTFRLPDMGYHGGQNYHFIRGTDVNLGGLLAEDVILAPKTLIRQEIPSLSDANFSDPAGATMSNHITHPAGWWTQGNTSKLITGLNNDVVGASSAEHSTATASLGTPTIEFRNPAPSNIVIAKSSLSLQFPAQSALFLIKVRYEEPEQPNTNPYIQSPQNNPFPPSITDPCPELSGFLI